MPKIECSLFPPGEDNAQTPLSNGRILHGLRAFQDARGSRPDDPLYGAHPLKIPRTPFCLASRFRNEVKNGAKVTDTSGGCPGCGDHGASVHLWVEKL